MNSRRVLQSLWKAALRGVDPEVLVRRWIAAESSASPRGRIGLFATGKAAAAMARGARTTGFDDALLVVPRGVELPSELRQFAVEAAHPEPDRSSVAAAKRAMAFFESFGSGDLILALISGGASSLLCLPRDGLTLGGKRRAIRTAMRAGTAIADLNALRTRLSNIKGGRLAEATAARVVTLVLADVPRASWRLTGSAPTISRRKRGDRSVLLAHNGSGIERAAAKARDLGLDVDIERTPLTGEAREAGARFARRLARHASGAGRPAVLLAGGETTVAIRDNPGVGGRNQELALGAALELAGTRNAVILAAGSDGIDGNTRNAGAFADGSTIARAVRAGLDAREFLARHDCARLFETLGDEFRTAATGTNVADWVFGIVTPKNVRK